MATVERESAVVRTQMFGYWKNFQPSLESMMLDKTAHIIQKDEQDEILQLLPDVSGKKVLELGAGIGRFTGVLAQNAKHVTAVDFMEDYVAVNRRCHGHLLHVDFIAADVMDLELPDGKFDIVFSNWLFMYLSDIDCIKLLQKILRWLSNDEGQVFFRESCFHSSGNMARMTNPTFYRSPADYQSLLESVRFSSESMRTCGFRILEAGSLRSYIKHKNNSYQIYFLSSKVAKEMNSEDSFQMFLDQKQYTRRGVLRYEWIFGKTFLSTGGLKTTLDFIDKLELKPGQLVLDVGCGVGGHDFYMAEKYDVKVLGVDLSANMMSIAIEHLKEREHLENKVKFVLRDITKAVYEQNSFDAVYSRDTLLHIEDKDTLFRNFYEWLKPGGKIFFTDYSKGEKEESGVMRAYVADRQYHLLTTSQYEKLLLNSGFTNAKCCDETQKFLESLHDELAKLRCQREDFLKEFSEEDYKCLEDGWISKIQRVSSGDQTWTSCYAEKPI